MKYIIDRVGYTKVGQREEFEIVGWGIHQTSGDILQLEILSDDVADVSIERIHRPDVIKALKSKNEAAEHGFRLVWKKENMPAFPLRVVEQHSQALLIQVNQSDLVNMEKDYQAETLYINDVYLFGQSIYLRGCVQTFHFDTTQLGYLNDQNKFIAVDECHWVTLQPEASQSRYYFEAVIKYKPARLYLKTLYSDVAYKKSTHRLKAYGTRTQIDYMSVLNMEYDGKQKEVCVSGNVIVPKDNDTVTAICVNKAKQIDAAITLTPYQDNRYPLFAQFVQQYQLFANFEVDETEVYDLKIMTASELVKVHVNPKAILTHKIPLSEWIRKFWNNFNWQNIRKGFNLLKSGGIKGLLQKVKHLSGQSDGIRQNYLNWYTKHRATKEELDRQRQVVFQYAPKISIVVPTFRTPENYLREMIESVTQQTYTSWELCIADGSNDEGKTLAIIQEYAENDERIRVSVLNENYGISGNTNECLKLATGEYIALFDHDDLLSLDVLYEIVATLQEERHDVIYTDEDKILENSAVHLDPHFKPDFNIGLLRSGNYITHFFVVKKEIVDRVGGFRSQYDGAQDFDFIFRCTELATSIKHIPKILYHWRIHPNSTAGNSSSKLYAYEAGALAVHDHLKRHEIYANVERQGFGNYRSHYTIPNDSLTIIVVSPENNNRLRHTLNMLQQQTYVHKVIVAYQSNRIDTTVLEQYFPSVQFICANGNVVDLVNQANENVTSDYILYVDDYLHIEKVDDIAQLMSIGVQDDVGVVAPLLVSPNQLVLHAGIVLGTPHDPMYIYQGLPVDETGYMLRHQQIMDYSAVTFKAFLTRTKLLREQGGFNRQYQELFFIDYCLKLGKKDLRVVYTPYVQWTYLRSLLEKTTDIKADRQLLIQDWQFLYSQGDPNYNPNLSLRDGMKLNE